MNIAHAKRIPIADYLERLGIKPTSVRQGQAWYLSPIRTEDTPSFKVNTGLNAWFDFGIGQGGDIIDLAKELHGVKTTSEALKHIASTMDGITVADRIRPPNKEEVSKDEVSILSVGPIAMKSLLSYVESRGISCNSLSPLKEVHYQRGKHRYFAVGMENASGGYELRTKQFKGTLGRKDITIIQGVQTDSVVVFEGMFDFLSYMELNGSPLQTAIILNSAGLKERALNFLNTLKPMSVSLYLDNDSAGKELVEYFSQNLTDTEIMDCSVSYADSKDLNESHLKRHHLADRGLSALAR